MIPLPPMPKLEDFPLAYDSCFHNTWLYKEALAAWERIAKEVIAANERASMGGKS